MNEKENKIVFQGDKGAYSHIACVNKYPNMEAIPAQTFEDAFACVEEGKVKYAMIPIENSLAGRVADIHYLLPTSNLYIVDEFFLPIRHQLITVKDSSLEQISHIMSHRHALGQCRKIIRKLNLKQIVAADTAGSARIISEKNDPTIAVIASELAAKTYNLKILEKNIEDADHNTTRFIILSSEPDDAEPNKGPTITSLVFRVRNVPAALYKAMGGFSTNNVNMTKLESYIVGGSFAAAQFYVDIEGHPSDNNVRLALEELDFFSNELKILGVYRASELRIKIEEESKSRKFVNSPYNKIL